VFNAAQVMLDTPFEGRSNVLFSSKVEEKALPPVRHAEPREH
jgi:hypothetical protein